ncbi:MAG: hypothetical protein Q4G63_11790 [Bacteroidia bacterium]|nr:hypothetical protein [Bacteroidia bacterium]
MTDKKHSNSKKESLENSRVSEPEITYEASSTVDKWNPNKPFHGTQEEWWEHFREIEKGEFTPLESANQEFDEWKKEYLRSKLS